ncbi:MAG: agmatine/peptidylarginine deiminase [Candidatus Binatia bacterium]
MGFRLPAEWERHAATWLAWPHNEESWPGHFGPIPAVWVAMVQALAPHEHVHILVNDAAAAATVRQMLHGAQVPERHVSLHHVPTNDAWARDHGPMFITRAVNGRRELAVVDWIYNAWGGKYPPWDADNAVPGRIAALLGMPLFQPGIVLEGGSVDVNGRGTLLTTEACLLNPNRNPHLDRAQIEALLQAYLGVRRILWLGAGIAGDDTDGHIDDLARFVDTSTVVTVVEDNPRDDNYEPLQRNYARLRRMRDADGRPLRVVTLPMPEPIYGDGQRLPASYANFYIANEVVLVPVFGDPHDAVAVRTLQGLFPRRRIARIDARELVLGLGACHCVTQQQPAV